MANLIQDNQRERAQVEKPELANLPKPTQPAAPSLPTEQGAVSAESEPLFTPESQDYSAFVDSEQQPTSEQQAPVTPPPAPAQPGANAPIVPELPNIFEDVVSTYNLSPYDPEIVNTKIPTVYTTTPDLSGSGRARKITGDLIKFQELEENRLRQLEQANRQQPRIQDTPNSTNVDKPWWRQGVLGWAGDILFGNEESRKATEQGRLNPLSGEFGRQGAGLGGLLKYTFGLTSNAPVGAVSDTYQGLNKLEETTGVNPDDIIRASTPLFLAKSGLELIFGDRKGQGVGGTPVSIFRFNPEAAEKQGSSIVRAILGDDVADIGDPKESTNTGTGRVFYNPRRKLGAPVWQDPLGLAAEVGLNLFNPVDNVNPVINGAGSVISYGISAVARRGSKPATTAVTSANRSSVVSELLSATPPKPDATARVAELPAISQPVQIPRVYKGDTQVVQTMLPAAVDSSLLARESPRVILSEAPPSSVVFNVGLGNPSTTPIENIDELVIRPHGEIVSKIAEVEPALVEGYAGTTVDELVEHVTKVDPTLDTSQFNTVVSNRLANRTRPVITAERIKKIETIKETVDKRSREAIEKLDQANALVQKTTAYSEASKSAIAAYETEVLEIGKELQSLIQASRGGQITEEFADRLEKLTSAFEAGAEEVRKAKARIGDEEFIAKLRLDQATENLKKTRLANDITTGKLKNDEFIDRPTILANNQEAKVDFEEVTGKQRPYEIFTNQKQENYGRFSVLTSIDDNVDPGLTEVLNTVDKLLEESGVALDNINIAFLSDTIDVSKLTSEYSLKYKEIYDYYESLPGYGGRTFEEFLLSSGSYDSSTDIVSISKRSLDKGSDFSVNYLLHEIGHKLDEALSPEEKIRFFNTPGLRDKFLTEYADSVADDANLADQEFFAEAFAEFVGRKTKLSEDNPTVANAINNAIRSLIKEPSQKLSLSTDDLKSAARELAGHKIIIGETLSKLDELFEETVDFGRRGLDSIEPKLTTVDEVLDTIVNQGKPNILPEAYANQSRLIRETIENNDWGSLNRILQKTGEDPGAFIAGLVDRHNRILSEPVTISLANPNRARASDLPATLYHGSALADWQPGYNVRLRGSRGELGYGQYYTLDPKIAEQYALARMGENANPETLERAIAPAVNEVNHKFEKTLDANAKLSSTSDFFQKVTVGLPPSLQKLVKRALGRTKENTYNSLLTKLESNLVKSGIEPTEDALTGIQKTISDNLRALGYDSVIDKKSGFFLGLTSEGVTKVNSVPVVAGDAMKAVTARYNADAYAAKFYPSRLTTSANLQDSTYKVYSQLHEKIDNKLADVQQELTNRLAGDVEAVLPKITNETLESKPKTVAEVIEEVNKIADDICGA